MRDIASTEALKVLKPSWTNPKVVVLGGSTLMGIHVAANLKDDGVTVFAADRPVFLQVCAGAPTHRPTDCMYIFRIVILSMLFYVEMLNVQTKPFPGTSAPYNILCWVYMSGRMNFDVLPDGQLTLPACSRTPQRSSGRGFTT
jgi:hypothetical protein